MSQWAGFRLTPPPLKEAADSVKLARCLAGTLRLALAARPPAPPLPAPPLERRTAPTSTRV